MPNGDNQCDRCGQWSGPGHACPTANTEVDDVTLDGLVEETNEVAYSGRMAHDQLRDLPSGTEATIVLSDGDRKVTYRGMARGLPCPPRSEGARRFTTIGFNGGNELMLQADHDATDMKVVRAHVDLDTLPDGYSPSTEAQRDVADLLAKFPVEPDAVDNAIDAIENGDDATRDAMTRAMQRAKASLAEVERTGNEAFRYDAETHAWALLDACRPKV